MSAEPDKVKEREQRQWWAVAEGGVQQVTGYSCAPANPNLWWCPEVGFTGSEGYHLFATRGEATKKAIAELEDQLRVIHGQIEKLRGQLYGRLN